MNFLGFLLRVPIFIVTKRFPPALALAANRFTVSFNYITFTITSDANHIQPPTKQRTWSYRKYQFTETGLYDGFM